MPIATPIDEALRDRPLDVVVRAAATIADTLWRLQHDLDIAYRDIKPACDLCLYLTAARLSI